MRKKIAYIGLVITLAVFLHSCRKDPIEPDVKLPPYNPTPYNLYRGQGYPQFRLPADNALTEEGVLLGRMLFYDPILSGDNTQSCASCHNQDFAFTDNEKKFSIGITGAVGKRNSMPIFNMMFNKNFFWDGRSPTLRHQVLQPIQDPNEMNSSLAVAVNKLRADKDYNDRFYAAFGTYDINSEYLAKALEQFLLTLLSFESKFDKNQRGQVMFTPSETNGFLLFNREPSNGGADCFHCHTMSGGYFSTYAMSNNGLDTTFDDLGFFNVTGKETDKGKFKIPSLRNIEYTAPYMHDGRFATLEEVMDFYSEGVHPTSPNIDPLMDEIPLGLNLTTQQKQDLIAFLKTLSDTTFINNPAYKNPF